MAANAIPSFTKNGRVDSVLVTAANTSSQGGGTIATDIFLVMTADATNGSYVEKVRIIATATTPTAMNPTVARIFVSSQSSGATTSANTFLVAEISLANLAADNATAAVPYYDVPLGIKLNASQSILVTNHAAPSANTAWRVTAFSGDY